MMKIMNEEALQLYWPDLITLDEKGYPFTNAMFYVKYLNNIPVGHTCYEDMGNWYFVGNSYVKKEFRGQGIHDELLELRNNDLKDKSKIAVLLPLEGSHLTRLEDRISKLQYTKVNNFFSVYGIMSFLDYVKFRKYNMWVLK
jgi:predicted GNAT family acetyltransferase